MLYYSCSFGAAKPIPIEKRCKAIVEWNVGSFNADGTEAEDTRTIACLSLYFCTGFLQPHSESERGRFLFLMVATKER